jgi:hypothetical protein
LLITTSANSNLPLPSSFPALPMTVNDPSVGEQMLVAAYPAALLDSQTIQTNLYISSALTQVDQLFTFSTTSQIDLVSLAPSVVSQSGSSGGAAVRASDGNLMGIITTETTGTTTADRELHAITIAHIDRSLAAEGQGGVVGLLNQNLSTEADSFNETIAPTEEQELINVLPQQ